jgi:membrane-associated phospholipid phosphatase
LPCRKGKPGGQITMNWLDVLAAQAVERIQHSAVYDALAATTHLGDGWVAATVAAVGAVGFMVAGRVRAAALLLLAVAAAFVTTNSLKTLIGRERPDAAWRSVVLPESASFPSGHASESTAAYGGLALLAARKLRRRVASVAVVAAGFGVAALVGVSRIYLGVHYFTDVAAGWTLGAALVVAALRLDRWRESAPPASET